MKVLAYTSPARGHLNPMMGPLLELRRRGAEVHVRTLDAGVGPARGAGLEAEPLAPEIQALTHTDHLAGNQIASGAASFATFQARAPHEVPDFEAALDAVRPDLALVDCTTYGAKAVAERHGIPWAESQPFLIQEPAAVAAPPYGLGMRPLRGPLGTVRDRSLGLFAAQFDSRARMPAINAGRGAAGLPPLGKVAEALYRAPLMLYFTALPFAYERPLPDNVKLVGPAPWDPPAAHPVELPAGERPLVVVACSSEFQDDGEIAAAALAGLRDRYRLVITTAGVDPASLGDHGDALVDRFLPHAEIIPAADVVVCHGGMGVTQKALSFGVPVCVVPWGRDQLDVAAHVVYAGAGTRVGRRLNPERLATAVEQARACRPGAARVRAGYEATGGTGAAADALETLA